MTEPDSWVGVDALLIDPLIEFDWVEAYELADLQVRDAAFLDHAPNESLGDVEAAGSRLDVEQGSFHGASGIWSG